MENSFKDKILICVDCKEEFAFTVQAQQYFAERGFTDDPKRCRSCYKGRTKNDGHGDGMSVWEPKSPQGFVSPRSGVNRNLPRPDSDSPS